MGEKDGLEKRLDAIEERLSAIEANQRRLINIGLLFKHSDGMPEGFLKMEARLYAEAIAD